MRIEELDASGATIAIGVAGVSIVADAVSDAAVDLGCFGPACRPVSSPSGWVKVADAPNETQEAPSVPGVGGATLITVGSATGSVMPYDAVSDRWSPLAAEGFTPRVRYGGTPGRSRRAARPA